MIESRRMARPAGPSIARPASSGPRCTSFAFMRARASRSGWDVPSSETMPQMPHMSAAGDGGERLADRAPHGLGEHPHVQVHRAVGDVLEVVRELLGPGVLARDAHLREAGHAGPHDQPLPVLRYLRAQLLEERRPDRPRPDEAHVAPGDVYELRQLVELRRAQHAPDPGDLAL